jgi:4-amino-4-deoxy-L-arabinose transferase-like glycosyltransferase
MFALLAILSVQAVMSLRLEGTAFEDEALYITAGRMELAHMLHGATLQGDYASYFSGAPVLYPLLAAALNAVGGLALARALSLVEMLAVTVLLHSISRELFNQRVAAYAAALFAVSEPVIFLGHLATFDATCLFLLASATWIVVRWSASWPAILLATPLAALAVAVKYTGVLFVPTIAVLPAIVGWRARGRRALLYPPAFAAIVGGLLYGGLRLAGHAHGEAISAALASQQQRGVSALAVGRESAAWGGVVMVLALVGVFTCALTGKKRARLGTVLAGTAFVAPACQMWLRSDVSLLKNIGFGLFFAAPLAGAGLVRLTGDRFSRRHVGTAVWCIALVLGASGWWSLYHSWPSPAPLVKALSPYLQPDARYLVEDPEVPIYYLRGQSDAQPGQFWPTSAITYVNGEGQRLTGDAGFAAAIRAGFFHMVVYNDYATPATDAVIVRALHSSPGYQLVAVLHLTDSNGPVNYYIWVLGPSPRLQLASARRPMLCPWTWARIPVGRRGSRTCTS